MHKIKFDLLAIEFIEDIDFSLSMHTKFHQKSYLIMILRRKYFFFEQKVQKYTKLANFGPFPFIQAGVNKKMHHAHVESQFKPT